MFLYEYNHNSDLPYCVYRIKNSLTGAIYIGSSGGVRQRMDAHAHGIRNRNHENYGIQYDSIWCEENDWSFRILSRHATQAAMVAREMLLIKIFVGRRSCYNNSLHYERTPTLIEWVLFDMQTRDMRLYLNRRSALRDLCLGSSDFQINALGLLQYHSYLLIKPGSGLPAIWHSGVISPSVALVVKNILSQTLTYPFIYNREAEYRLGNEVLKLLPTLLEQNVPVSELLRPSVRLGKTVVKRADLDFLVKRGDIVMTDQDDGQTASLTPKGRALVQWDIEQDRRKKAQASETTLSRFSQLSIQETSDARAATAIHHAVHVYNNNPNLANEETSLPEGKYLIATSEGKVLKFFKYDSCNARDQNLRLITSIGKILGVFEQLDGTDLAREFDIGCITSNGRCNRSAHPDADDFHKKRVPWQKNYDAGDTAVSLFRWMDSILIAIVTKSGSIMFVSSNDIRPMGFNSSFLRFANITKSSVVAACSVFPGNCLLAVTSDGIGIPIDVSEEQVLARGDRPRKIQKHKPSMGDIVWMMPQDRSPYAEQCLRVSTTSGRDIHLGALCDLVAEDSTSPFRLVEMQPNETILAINLVSSTDLFALLASS
jgi:hypothetical protein